LALKIAIVSGLLFISIESIFSQKRTQTCKYIDEVRDDGEPEKILQSGDSERGCDGILPIIEELNN